MARQCSPRSLSPSISRSTLTETSSSHSSRKIGFSDGTPRVIRKIDTDGIITTVAGGGREETSLEGGPATDAELFGGWQFIDVDAKGNLYIGEPAGHRVRKVTFND